MAKWNTQVDHFFRGVTDGEIAEIIEDMKILVMEFSMKNGDVYRTDVDTLVSKRLPRMNDLNFSVISGIIDEIFEAHTGEITSADGTVELDLIAYDLNDYIVFIDNYARVHFA